MIQRIRRIALEFNFPYKILMDLGGPKVRVAAPEKMAVQTNQIVTLVLEKPKKKNQIQCDNPLVFLTVEYFTGHTQGQIYILPHSPRPFEKEFHSAKSPIKNLFLVGPDLAGNGIVGQLMKKPPPII